MNWPYIKTAGIFVYPCELDLIFTYLVFILKHAISLLEYKNKCSIKLQKAFERSLVGIFYDVCMLFMTK